MRISYSNIVITYNYIDKFQGDVYAQNEMIAQRGE